MFRKLLASLMAISVMATVGMGIGAGAEEFAPSAVSVSTVPFLPSTTVSIEPLIESPRNINTGPNITYIKAHPYSNRPDGLYGNEDFYAAMSLPGNGSSLATLSLSQDFLDVAKSFDTNVWYVTVKILISGTGLTKYQATRDTVSGSSLTESFSLPSSGTYILTYSYWVNDFPFKTSCGVSVFHNTPYGTSSSVAGAHISKY